MKTALLEQMKVLLAAKAQLEYGQCLIFGSLGNVELKQNKAELSLPLRPSNTSQEVATTNTILSNTHPKGSK